MPRRNIGFGVSFWVGLFFVVTYGEILAWIVGGFGGGNHRRLLSQAHFH